MLNIEKTITCTVSEETQCPIIVTFEDHPQLDELLSLLCRSRRIDRTTNDNEIIITKVTFCGVDIFTHIMYELRQNERIGFLAVKRIDNMREIIPTSAFIESIIKAGYDPATVWDESVESDSSIDSWASEDEL